MHDATWHISKCIPVQLQFCNSFLPIFVEVFHILFGVILCILYWDSFQWRLLLVCNFWRGVVSCWHVHCVVGWNFLRWRLYLVLEDYCLAMDIWVFWERVLYRWGWRLVWWVAVAIAGVVSVLVRKIGKISWCRWLVSVINGWYSKEAKRHDN